MPKKPSIQKLIKEREIEKETFTIMVAQKIIMLAFVFLILRIASSLFFSIYLGIDWYIGIDFGFIPVLGYEADFRKFSLMNTYSQLFVAIIMVLGFLNAALFEKKKISNMKHNARILGWYLSLWMLVLMYLSSVYFNPEVRFQFDERLGFIIIPIVLLSTILFLRWKEKYDLLEEEKMKKIIDKSTK